MLKILLVDDEKAVLKGLEYIFTKHCPEYEIVGMVESGAEALQILETAAVHVVITDVKMPEMDGIELTKRIRMLYPKTVVVVLSGYSDFEYVRQSMKNGAYDYLLKPCKYQAVLDILHKIEESIRQSDKKSQENMNKKYLEAVVSGKKELPEEWAAYPHMQMVVMSIQGNRDPSTEEYIKMEFEKLNISTEMLDVINIDENMVSILRKPLDLQAVKERLYYCRQSFFKKGFQPYVVIYNFVYGPKCLEQAYNTCREMIEFLEFNELSMVLDIEMYQKYMEQQKKYAVNTYFSSYLLGRYILGAHIQKVQQYISTNLNQLYDLDVYMDPIRIKKEVLEELIPLEHILKDHGIDVEQIFGKQIDYLYELKRLKAFRSLLNWLKNFTMAVVMSAEDGENTPYYIHSAMKYIEIHYMEDLSLKTVADEVYLNPWYFSTQFKKYTGLSFSEYLNQVRVRIAKELLKQKDLKIYQVAEMVGFQDAAYFSTVFKSMENITPKEYQKIV